MPRTVLEGGGTAVLAEQEKNVAFVRRGDKLSLSLRINEGMEWRRAFEF